jgi:hypothetical protein
VREVLTAGDADAERLEALGDEPRFEGRHHRRGTAAAGGSVRLNAALKPERAR